MRIFIVALLLITLIHPSPVFAANCTGADGKHFTSTASAAEKFSLAIRACDNAPARIVAASYGVNRPAIAAGTVRSIPAQPRKAIPSQTAALSTSAYSAIISEFADRRRIDPLLLEAMIHVESRARPAAVSPKGARGLMQVMPATARGLGFTGADRDLHDPAISIDLGTAYLRVLHKRFGNDLPLLVAAYNAGEGAVEKYGRTIPPYRETQSYVRDVLSRYEGLRSGASTAMGAR